MASKFKVGDEVKYNGSQEGVSKDELCQVQGVKEDGILSLLSKDGKHAFDAKESELTGAGSRQVSSQPKPEPTGAKAEEPLAETADRMQRPDRYPDMPEGVKQTGQQQGQPATRETRGGKHGIGDSGKGTAGHSR